MSWTRGHSIMKLPTHIVCLCLTVALAWADHHHEPAHLDRCKGIEMDAVAVNEEGIPYFFKGHHLFKGFHGKAELSNKSFSELDDHHHLGHVDAAFHMHYEDEPIHHDHIFFFLDTMVFSYYQHKLEDGYPKTIAEVFPGIPDHLDAAVECPKPECDEDSVIFFKGDDIYHCNVRTKAVDKKEFTSMPNCTSAFLFMEHYYCFHGHRFSKFDPKTGEVHDKHCREARDYFTRCSKFRHHFIRKFEGNDTLESDTIESDFKELHSEVDAVFSYDGHLYMIKDDHLYLYKVGEPHTHLDGYPKPVKDKLGIEGPIDAAFVCEDHHIAHIIKGQHIYDVELKTTPRVPTNERPIPLFRKVDAAMCGPGGVKVIAGNHFYHFDSVMVFVAARAQPEQHRVSLELFGCDH